MSIHVSTLEVRHFRCFAERTFDLGYPWIVLEGANGSGKTSLLEALHFMCYLRSFRAANVRTLIQEGHDTLFVRAQIYDEGQDQSYGSRHDLKVGYTGNHKVVSLNGKSIVSYKEILASYRVVSLTDEDMALIQEGPDGRRAFVDRALVMHDAGYGELLRIYRRVLEQRNKLISSCNKDREAYDLWTYQLWEKTLNVQQKRIEWLKDLEKGVNGLLKEFFGGIYQIQMHYCPKKGAIGMPYEQFRQKYRQLEEDESRYGYSLFGGHLDDIVIEFQNKHSRLYASRGQQKLVIVLLKLAHLIEFARLKGAALVLLDDFLTDFDQEKAERLLVLLKEQLSSCQCIITATSITQMPEYLRSFVSQCHRMSLTGGE